MNGGDEKKNLYSPIGDYAIIGDCRCAALVSRFGSIDWLCLPRFDSPSIFGAILDARRGGFFSIRPSVAFETQRRYLGNTNVVQTDFRTENGLVRLTDFMSLPEPGKPKGYAPLGQILRRVECLGGEAEVEVNYRPRPHYSRVTPRLAERGALGIHGEHKGLVFILRSEAPLTISTDRSMAWGRVPVRPGRPFWVSFSYDYGQPAVLPVLGDGAARNLGSALSWWENWARRCTYEGPYRNEVIRSALALKLMAHSLSGAVVAAPTTSLPEKVGGVRNWDYRYCWLRDASMTLRALYLLGYKEEAASFMSWLTHTTRLTRPELRVLYDVYGRAPQQEKELPLEGYAGSRPIRVGNNAARQVQLDIYGEVAEGALAFFRWGERLDRGAAAMLRGVGQLVCQRWREPDAGIWEIRSTPKHHTYSKVMCWVTLDRLLALHELGQVRVPVQEFQRERDAIRKEIERSAYSERLGSYTASFGSDDVDVSLLLLPIYRYIEATHPRMRSTFACIQQRLGRNGLLYRYSREYDDGLPGGEGTFAVGAFWSVECLALQGEREAAHDSFNHLLGYANDLGLYGEEIEPDSGEALGNFPQAYTHVGLINAALALRGNGGR